MLAGALMRLLPFSRAALYSHFMIRPLKPSTALDHALWMRLASVSEASIERYRPSLPRGLEMEDLKQEIISQIPKLVAAKQAGVSSASMELEYYMYCRASYETRRILHRLRSRTARFFSNVESIELAGKQEQPSEELDVKEELSLEMSELTPTTQTMLLLVYDGLTYKQIARRLKWSKEMVQFVIDRATAILDIPGPAELMEKTTREIKLKLIEGWSVEQIVSVLGCNAARVVRIREWLRQIERQAA